MLPFPPPAILLAHFCQSCFSPLRYALFTDGDLQSPPERAAGVKKLAFGSADLNVQHFADFFVLVAFYVIQHQYLTVSRRQRGNGALQVDITSVIPRPHGRFKFVRGEGVLPRGAPAMELPAAVDDDRR